MKKQVLLLFSLSLLQFVSFGQIIEQIDTSYKQQIKVLPLPKEGLLKNIYFISNMRFAFQNDFTEGTHTGSKFRMQEWRPEILGEVFPGVSFRFRTSLFPNANSSTTDNLKRDIDFLFVSVKLSSKVNLTLGKMAAEWGGYEFDHNPINMFQFNDIVNFSDPFLAGVKMDYKANDKHTFSMQVVNANTRNFNEMYGSMPGVSAAKFPGAVLAKWRGNFMNGKFQTLYSYNLYTQAEGKVVNMFTLGNQLKLRKWKIQYDFKFSDEELDRTGVVSGIIPDDVTPYSALDARYVEHWMFLERTISPRLKINTALMVSDAYWNGNPDPRKDNHLRTAWSVVPSIEYNPNPDLNLRFFCSYIGRFFRYSDYAKSALRAQDINTSRIQIGFISPLRVF
ncbi:MAG TPA: porin [Phnomibacter sp.]|nr:porin [Phnomibacter sp.]